MTRRRSHHAQTPSSVNRRSGLFTLGCHWQGPQCNFIHNEIQNTLGWASIYHCMWITSNRGVSRHIQSGFRWAYLPSIQTEQYCILYRETRIIPSSSPVSDSLLKPYHKWPASNAAWQALLWKRAFTLTSTSSICIAPLRFLSCMCWHLSRIFIARETPETPKYRETPLQWLGLDDCHELVAQVDYRRFGSCW